MAVSTLFSTGEHIMIARTFVRWAGLGIVWIAGIGCAGSSFGADGKKGLSISQDGNLIRFKWDTDSVSVSFAVAAPEGDKAKEIKPTNESKPAEKAVQAAAGAPKELAMRSLPTYRIAPPDILQIDIRSKAAKEGETQPPKKTDAIIPPGSPPLHVEIWPPAGGADDKLDDSNIVKTEAGAQPANKANEITFDSVPSLTKTGSGTLTISGSNTYSGTTTVVGGSTYLYPGVAKSGGTLTLGYAPPSAGGLATVKSNSGTGGAELSAGQYLVSPDGTINMRQYGIMQVTGMTVAELKAALEKHLANYMEAPEVWVDVSGYNSQVFYIVTDGAGSGDNVRRVPICGNETVLDAVAMVGGLSQFSSKRIWVSRPSPTDPKSGAVLPVDYDAMTQRGATETNYQIMPGDRLFIAGDRAIAFNVDLGKATAPLERILGVTSLGAATIESVERLLLKQDGKQE
jgi:autotransporter-associated beta strand protein